MSATFKLSAFGDEIADDLAEQLRVLNQLNVGYLELRGAWGKNVLKLTDDEVARVGQMCADAGVTVSALGSPVGKSPLADPIENELGNLRRLIDIARALGTRTIRVFSFYPADISTNAHYDQHLDEAIAKLKALADLAAAEDMQLVLENEKDIVGDTVARCRAILAAVDSPSLRFAWDPANFVQVKEAKVTERGWPVLGEYVGYIHIKDALLNDGGVTAAGEGDGQVPELLTHLRDSGYQGFLALEPHLVVAGHSTGFSGTSGMTYAVEKLRQVMAATGCEEIH
ncbi:MAG: TIM barrel protein [Caldilineaceae bacterium]|nr:sugar phosphate isomerase/epimerase [Caldilineaceae bacterium]